MLESSVLEPEFTPADYERICFMEQQPNYQSQGQQPYYPPQQPYQNQPGQPGYPQQPMMPQQQPPKKKRNPFLIGCGAALALVVIIIVIVVIASAASAPKASSNTGATGNTPQATSAPATTGPITWKTIQSFSGNGIKKTGVFAVPADWKINYTCTGGSVSGTNFDGALAVTVYGSDGTVIDLAVNATCKGGQ